MSYILGKERKTLRNRQMAPTAVCLEDVYQALQDAEDRIFMDPPRIAAAIRHLTAAISVLADVVDRHITAPDVETRVDAS